MKRLQDGADVLGDAGIKLMFAEQSMWFRSAMTFARKTSNRKIINIQLR